MKRYTEKQVDLGNLIQLEDGNYEPTLTYINGDRDEPLLEHMLGKDFDYTSHGNNRRDND